MKAGTVVATRFLIERLAGEGGMGAVFRARDLQTDRPVALKVLHRQGVDEARRFAREARVLAGLEHPGIVEHVAHGVTEDGVLYLAMEWLQGEDLADRLHRAPIDLAEGLAVVRSAAAAIAVAHAHGIVHRDIKPTNLFLVGGDLGRVKVLDFGIARSKARTFATQAGFILGTPGYMAPEQARGEAGIDARADVFALGAVLFEVLAGRPPFTGDRALAVLAKVLFEDAPPLRAFAPDVPEVVTALVAQMLSKQPDARPADAAAVVAALDAVTDSVAPPEVPGPPQDARTQALGAMERRLLWALFVGGVTEPAIGEVVHASREHARARTVASIAGEHGLELNWLVDGSAVLLLVGGGAATDQAARAARCALAIRRVAPDVPIALAAARAVLDGPDSTGAIIDRAAALLGRPGIRIDDVTAGLVESRFEVENGELVSERPEPTGGLILGRTTPFVGREKEMALARATIEECVEEPAPRVLLVTGAAGVGKSRLAHEIASDLRTRSATSRIWTAHGDPLGGSSPFWMLSDLLRGALGLSRGTPLDAQRQAMLRRLGGMTDGSRVAAFLGEIADVPFEADERSALRAAREDAILMGDQMRRAFEEFLGAETARGLVVLVLEDLQWADAPSVAFVDAALRRLRGHPLLVLATARPEVHDVFPKLWAERSPVRVELGPLGRRAAEQLARTVLGEHHPERVARAVTQADGNPFFLEELLRAEALGHGAQTPGTVVAMVQARLDQVVPEARRVLRAASVIGRTFWRSALERLLGNDARSDATAERLVALEALELVTPSGDARFAGEEAWAFRQALVAQVAYDALTEEDRRLGHALAAQWLQERAGDGEAAMVAEHLEKGGAPDAALPWLRRAAETALEGNDFAGVLARVARAVSCGAEGEELGAMLLLGSEAHWWRGEYAEAEDAANRALELFARGCPEWLRTVGTVAGSAMLVGHRDGVAAAGRALAAHDAVPGARAAFLRAAARVAPLLFNSGESEIGVALMGRIERTAPLVDAGPATDARIEFARGVAAKATGDFGAFMARSEASAAHAEVAGDLRYACMMRINAGYALLELGQPARAEVALREALSHCDRLGLASLAPAARHNLGLALSRQGRHDEGWAEEERALEELATQGNRRIAGAATLYQARIALDRGDPALAEERARAALGIAGDGSPLRPYTLSVLAAARREQGALLQAVELASEAYGILQSLTAAPDGEAYVRLVHAELVAALGEHQGARRAAREAAERLEERAARIADPELRRSFLQGVPENAGTLELWTRIAVEGGWR